MRAALGIGGAARVRVKPEDGVRLVFSRVLRECGGRFEEAARRFGSIPRW
jgi:hypothetical protein